MSEREMSGSPEARPNPLDMHFQQPPQSPGMQLAAHRKARGWTVEQVANQLNLAPRQVAALESDDYPALPGMPIVRGFIRSYAKLLKVDAAPLLAPIGGETVLVHEAIMPHKTLSAPFAEKRLPPMMADRSAGLSSKWVVGALLAVLLGVAIWAAQQNAEVADLQKTAAEQMKEGLTYLSGPEEKQQATPEKAEQPEAPAASADAGGIQPAEMSAAPVVSTVAAQPEPVSNVPAPVALAQQPAPRPESAASVAKDALVLNARQDAWIEVRQEASKRVVFSRLMKAGETETIAISDPIALVVGNAAGVEATLRGEPLQLKAGGGNVARVSLK